MVGVAILAGLVAAGASWLINGKLVNTHGSKAVIYIGPAVEELSKTGLALLFGAPIVLTHVVFGALEAIWELYTSRRRIIASFIALVSHMLFGLITVTVFRYAGVLPALIVAFTTHMLWNYWVMKKAKQSV